MAKLILNDVTSGYASTTLVNANNVAIEAAFENTLSRDGTGPNQMGATLDMNGHNVLNIGTLDITTLSADNLVINGEVVVPSAVAVSTLPDPTGHSTKFLQTDGISASWQTPDSSEVSFSQSDTGAIARTAQAKLRESMSIMDFGAVGNGTADDTASLQAAVLAARTANRRLYIPAGTYNYSALTTGDYDYLYGDGFDKSILHYTGTGNAFELGSGAVLKDLKITGTTSANNGITAGGDNGSYTLKGSILLDNVRVTGFKQQGQVSAVSIPTVSGSGYDGTTAVVFSAPPTGTTATGTPVISGGALIGVTITNRGSGYTSPPTITTTGAGSGADVRAYIGSSGICLRALVAGTFRNVVSNRNWRGMLTTRGSLQTALSFYDNNFGYTEGSQGYWNAGPAVELEGLSASIFNNTIMQTAGQESVKITGKYVEDVSFTANYYEATNLAQRGSVVLLTGTATTDEPIKVSFINDLIGVQPTYPLPTVNGYPATILPMSEYVYNFTVANSCQIINPKWISENYYYTIFAGAGAIGCTYDSLFGLDIHNQSLVSRTQGIKVLPKYTDERTLYGHTYTTTGGFTNDLNSATPSVSGNNKHYKFANTTPTAITDFLDSFVGQQILISFTEDNTSFASSANIKLSGNGTTLFQAGVKLLLERTTDSWVEVGRINKNIDRYIPDVLNGAGAGVFNPANTQILAVTATSPTLNFSGIFAINGVTNTVNIISDPTSKLSTTYLAAGTLNLSFTTSAYRLFNSTGTTLNITVKTLL